MTLKELKQYGYYAKKLKKYNAMIQSEIVDDAARGSTKEFPYILRVSKLHGLTPKGKQLYHDALSYWFKLKKIKEYISAIEDQQTRDMFELVFIKGKTYRAAAFSIGGKNTEDSVKKRIYRYIEKH